MHIDLSINPSQEADNIISFITNNVSRAGFSKVVLGLSGGLDSSVCCLLAVKALRKENVHIGLFPYQDLNKEGLEDAQLLTHSLNIAPANIHLIDIKPLVDPVIALDRTISNLRKGNIMVRMRMILLFDLSKKLPALVLGTENRTEHLLGYFTRFGDSASDIEPIIHLYKTQVRQLAKFLDVPEKIINKVPTAGMWSGQTDEDELGFTYEQADQILYLHVEQKKEIEEIVGMGFAKETAEEVIKYLNSNKFKQVVPYKLDTI